MPYEIPDPFHEGQDAYVLGITRDRCPYPLQSVEHETWLEGWDDAKAMHEEAWPPAGRTIEPQ